MRRQQNVWRRTGPVNPPTGSAGSCYRSPPAAAVPCLPNITIGVSATTRQSPKSASASSPSTASSSAHAPRCEGRATRSLAGLTRLRTNTASRPSLRTARQHGPLALRDHHTRGRWVLTTASPVWLASARRPTEQRTRWRPCRRCLRAKAARAGRCRSRPQRPPVSPPVCTARAGRHSERYLEPNTRSRSAVSPAVWNLTTWPSR